jgi:hypothetical protein
MFVSALVKIFNELKAGIFHSRGDSQVEWKIHLSPNENILLWHE